MSNGVYKGNTKTTIRLEQLSSYNSMEGNYIDMVYLRCLENTTIYLC